MFVAIKEILPWERRGDERRGGGGEEARGGDGGRENEREVRKKVRERKATFFNHLTYLIAMNNKCVGLQLGR